MVQGWSGAGRSVHNGWTITQGWGGGKGTNGPELAAAAGVGVGVEANLSAHSPSLAPREAAE